MMCKKLLMLTSFMLVLGLVSSAPAQLPEGWQNQDIGSTVPGSASEADGVWTITANGADIWGNADAFHYVYQLVSGDGSITTCVTDTGTGSNEWAKGGVMLRQNLTAGSVNVFGAITGGSGGGATFQWRSSQDGSSSSDHPLSGIAPPYWVRLVREGNTFTVFVSADGATWEQEGSSSRTLDFMDPVLVGLAVTSHADGELRTYTLDNLDTTFAPFFKAYAPDPADGAIEVDPGTLEWTAGPTAVSHIVYLSEDATIDDADKIAETDMTIVAVTLTPGVTYSWRVDEVEADGDVIEGDVWTFTTIPLEAHFPDPADGAENVPLDVTLSWTPGKVVVMHDLYFGTDEAAIAAGDMSTFKGKLMQASYDPGLLEPFTTYYWRVDEFTPTGTVPGPVWSFSTPKYLPIEDGPVTLDYDNTAEPYVSEVAFETPMDITAGGVVTDLTLRFKGAPGNLKIDEATGTYEIAGSGADIWGSADQFHYVYKELTGDAMIVARVVDNGTGSDAWAKGGVMIRESIDAGSKHAIMALTGGNGEGIAFQARPETGGSSWGFQGDITAAPPHWVRLTRAGNTITGEHSADGVTWELMTDTSPDGDMTDPIDIEMTDPVLIGLFVTAHAAGEIRTYTMDNVSIEGDVSADFVSEDIDSVSGNSAEPVYAALEDWLGAVATVVHPYPAATQIDSWRQWTIPLDEFAGVDSTLAAKLSIGVGDGNPGGVGTIDIAEIRVVEHVPVVGPVDVTVPGDTVLGIPRGLPCGGSPSENYSPCAELPPNVIDDDVNTKYLNFGGNFDPGEEPSGFQVTPLNGPSVVSGLTFTTANDAEPRDPVAFELSGSNGTIEGPYELIAAGEIVDFAGETAWPRFTKNETPITFANDVVYSHYKLLFTAIRDAANANSMQIAEVELLTGAYTGPGELEGAFAFGSRNLDCATYNVPWVNYTMVHHENPEAIQYDAAKGYGYEVIYPTDSPFGDRSGYGKFGPFDDSPNNRSKFGDECPEELYDSFIGAKSFTNEVSAATMGDMDTPSPNPEGIIFRVDVPNGFYRFVGAFGEADNVHAHRILAEDGGSGPPANIGANYVVLVHNHDQAQQTIGEADASKPGEGVFARVGFAGKIPPPGDGIAPSPQFVDMDENGRPTDAGANSPTLEVTQGYIRIHQLQGNSNDGPGGSRDANGGDIVILELWRVEQ